MSRHIDAELLKAEIRKAFPSLQARTEINIVVNSQPTIDIVRCKECKWHDTCCRNIYEDWRDATPTDIEYCSHGEREGE